MGFKEQHWPAFNSLLAIWKADGLPIALSLVGLGLFSLVFVLIPFVLIIALLMVIIVAGVFLIGLGCFALLVAILQILGMSLATPWSNPLAGIILSIVISVAGVFMVIVGFGLARFFYHLGIRYLKWNIRVIRGSEKQDREESCPAISTIPRDGAKSLDLQVRFGAGDLSIGEGSGGQNLVDLTARDGTSCTSPSVTSSLNGSSRQVRIRGRHGLATWWSDESSPLREIGVSRDVPVALDVQNKAGRTVLTLGTLNLTSLRIRNGAGETRVDLTGYHGGGFEAQIKNGVGHLEIRVPKECNLRIRVHRGVGDTDVHGLIVEGDTYINRPERQDAPQITCLIKQGIGSISLEAV